VDLLCKREGDADEKAYLHTVPVGARRRQVVSVQWNSTLYLWEECERQELWEDEELQAGVGWSGEVRLRREL